MHDRQDQSAGGGRFAGDADAARASPELRPAHASDRRGPRRAGGARFPRRRRPARRDRHGHPHAAAGRLRGHPPHHGVAAAAHHHLHRHRRPARCRGRLSFHGSRRGRVRGEAGRHGLRFRTQARQSASDRASDVRGQGGAPLAPAAHCACEARRERDGRSARECRRHPADRHRRLHRGTAGPADHPLGIAQGLSGSLAHRAAHRPGFLARHGRMAERDHRLARAHRVAWHQTAARPCVRSAR